jgi:tetratricopeptide (TPR) repeat protein
VGWLIKTAVAVGLVAWGGAAPCAQGPGQARVLPEAWSRAATDPAARAEVLAALEDERARGGYGDMAPVAAALLAQARRAPDPGTGEGLALLAAAAAPSDPRPQAFLTRWYLGEALQPASALHRAWNWARSVATDPWIQAVAALWVAALVPLAAWVAVAALVVVATVVFGSALFHDYRDSFPRRFRRRVPAALVVLMGAVLWSAGTGPALFLLLIGLALSPYLPSRGRWALGVLLTVGCLVPQGLGGLAAVGEPAGERAWAMYRVWRGDAGADLEEGLERLFPAPDARILFAQARLARRQGNYGAAEQRLQRALVSPGGSAALLRTELGTLRFVAGDGDGALDEFQRAAEADPNAALPWLGRYAVHLEKLELGLADDALARARALGGEGVDREQRRFTESARHIAPVAPALPAAWVRDELLGDAGAERGWVDALVQGFFLPVGAVQPAAFGLLGIGVVLGAGRSGNGRRSRRCPTCGVVVCPRCGRRVKGTDLCPACWANARESAADSAERERQTLVAQRWQARSRGWRRAGQALLPGWTQFLFGRPLAGLALGLAWAGGASALVLGILYPIALLPWAKPTFPWAAAAVVLGAHALGFRQAVGKPGPREM